MKIDNYDIEILKMAYKFKDIGGIGLPTLDRMLGIKYGDDSDFLITNELQAPSLRRRLDRLIDAKLIVKIPPKNTYMLTDEGVKFIS